ncbi:MAG: DUF3467 domain-containing protein [Alphaproteobacteria bacterium]|jgi:hypothetical protein|nr:DUF3467 domain-containing protein [Alphaproteobacteria bacterium]MDP6876266.1 DUF3467 domain-containing protein [Alphaproteobacteria bacterium]
MADETKPQDPAPANADSVSTGEPAQSAVPTVTWDDSNMGTSYANVVNVASTREEVTLFFGTNQTWNVRDSNGVTVQLTDRIVLNPYAAKRLWMLLGNVLKEYENRFGALNLDIQEGPGGN